MIEYQRGLFGGGSRQIQTDASAPKAKTDAEIAKELDDEFNATRRRKNALNILTTRTGGKLGQ